METKRESETNVEERESKRTKTEESTQEKKETTGRQSFLLETNVGIRKYVTNSVGFSGIIKHRYTDFLVNEVDIAGNVVHLTDIQTVPQESKKEVQEVGDLASLVGADLAAKFDQFLQKEKSDPNAKFIFPKDEDKEHRTKVHTAIKSMYNKIDTQTTDGCVCAYFLKSARKERGFSSWPKDRGDYLSFVLYKENKDTSEAILVLSKMLGVKPKAFAYAGTKDKRAVTTQRVTAYRVEATKARNLNAKLYGIRIGNFTYSKDHLRLGDLSGNRFTIIIRDVHAEDDVINQAVKDIKEIGFLNYFGMQRFGISSIGTHLVGKALLKQDYESAVQTILEPRPEDAPEIANARKYWKGTRDAKGTLDLMPKYMVVDRQLLLGLQKHGGQQFLNSLYSVPRNMRTMYVHAYQSYIWNEVLSQRIELFGTKPAAGDLIVVEESKQIAVADDTKEEETEDEISETEKVQEKYNFDTKVRALTEEDIKSGKFTIWDIVLPLPGDSITYPPNMISVYTKLLAADGLNIKMPHPVKDFKLAGSYRKIVEKPANVEWKILHYNDTQQDLAVTDLMKLQQQQSAAVSEGKFKAVQVAFTLASSTYATMLFRELMKTDTASGSHKALAKEFIEKHQ